MRPPYICKICGREMLSLIEVIEYWDDIYCGNCNPEAQEKLNREKTDFYEKLAKQNAGCYKKCDSKAQEKSNREKADFYEKLTKLVPDWEIINKDHKFKGWLQGKDALYSEKTKMDFLTEAFNKFDVQKVASFFKKYTRIQNWYAETNIRSECTENQQANKTKNEQVRKQRVWFENSNSLIQRITYLDST